MAADQSILIPRVKLGNQGFEVSKLGFGTTKIKNLDNNIGCIKVKLTNEDLQEISAAIPINEVAGERIPDSSLCCTWKFANTPPKHI
ncbi:hypothetical protein EZV62_007185 [Acer yangbiense]|uniref:Uncharacterized protein n=1 Tax=Acer yangbiense TaxID=1000413 RepID=A0A5C7I987_9ROSI|nr:hypothetical protein EZV62_007185 [Acer yangbiense]